MISLGLLTVRADARPRMGTGHVMRMIALAQAWAERGGEVRFLGRIEPEALRNRLAEGGFRFVEVPAAHPDPADLRALMEETAPGHWVALDGYHFDTGYQRAVRQAGRRTLVLDDVNDRGEYAADVLLNQNIEAEGFRYRINPEAVLLAGPRYALLRREFRCHEREERPVPERARNILVTCGGADPDNATGRMLEALALLRDPGLQVRVVAGAANLHLAAVREAAAALPGTCEVLHAPGDMPGLMAWADLVLSAAGSTCWEICFLGRPMVITAIAGNQEGIAAGLSRAGVAALLDKNAALGDMAAEVGALIADQGRRAAMGRAAARLVDGQGALRVADALFCAVIRLRPVQEDDWRLLLDWRNHPAVRAVSFQTGVLDAEQHRQWLAGKLGDPACLMRIAVDAQGAPLGQIRLDRQEAVALVSLSVAPKLSGRGIGTAMTRLACAEAADLWPGVRVAAMVRLDNAASAAMFRRAGFRLAREALDAEPPHLYFERE